MHYLLVSIQIKEGRGGRRRRGDNRGGETRRDEERQRSGKDTLAKGERTCADLCCSSLGQGGRTRSS